MHHFWSLAADWGVVFRLRDQFAGQTAGGEKLLGVSEYTELHNPICTALCQPILRIAGVQSRGKTGGLVPGQDQQS